MAISLVGTAGNTGGTASVTVTLPTLQQGDVVYVAAYGNSFPSGATITANNSFAAITANQVGLTYNCARWFRKVMGPVPDTSVTLSYNIASWAAAVAICLRGVDATTPEDATPTLSAWTTSNQPNSPSITTVTNGAWVISTFVKVNNAAIGAAPSGYSNTVSAVHVNSATAAGAMKEVATAGGEDPGAWGTTSTSSAWLGCTIAVRPEITGSLLRPHPMNGIGGFSFRDPLSTLMPRNGIVRRNPGLILPRMARIMVQGSVVAAKPTNVEHRAH